MVLRVKLRGYVLGYGAVDDGVVEIGFVCQYVGIDAAADFVETDSAGEFLGPFGVVGFVEPVVEHEGIVSVLERHGCDVVGIHAGECAEETVEDVVVECHAVVAPVLAEHVAEDQEDSVVGARCDEPVGDAVEGPVAIDNLLENEEVAIEHLGGVVSAGAEYGGVHPCTAVACEQFEP